MMLNMYPLSCPDFLLLGRFDLADGNRLDVCCDGSRIRKVYMLFGSDHVIGGAVERLAAHGEADQQGIALSPGGTMIAGIMRQENLGRALGRGTRAPCGAQQLTRTGDPRRPGG